MPASRLVLLTLLLLPTIAGGQTTQPTTVEEKLQTRLAEFSLDGLTLPQAFTAIADKTRLNIVADWDSLADGNLDRDRKLRGRLFDVTAREAILVAMTDAGAKAPAEIVIDENLVRLKRPLQLITRVYPIGKLIDREKQSRAPSTQPAIEQNDAAADAVVKAITTTIDSDTWRDFGGTFGASAVLGRQWIVTQTTETHAKVEQLLRELEKDDARK